MRPPTSLMAAIPPADVERLAAASPLWPTYAVEIDRESARERLAAKAAREEIDVRVPEPGPTRPPQQRRAPRRSTKKDDGNVVTDYLGSREGRQMANRVLRGVFDMLKKRR
jgi:hypothetical protein